MIARTTRPSGRGEAQRLRHTIAVWERQARDLDAHLGTAASEARREAVREVLALLLRLHRASLAIERIDLSKRPGVQTALRRRLRRLHDKWLEASHHDVRR